MQTLCLLLPIVSTDESKHAVFYTTILKSAESFLVKLFLAGNLTNYELAKTVLYGISSLLVLYFDLTFIIYYM